MSERLARALDRATGARPIPGNALRHLPGSVAALDAMLDLIRAARRSVHFENYIIRDDRTGRRFADALAERAHAGVRVRILYDALGSRSTGGGFWRALERAGAEVRAFGPIWTSGLLDAFSRDHRKLVVADGHEAILGGLCIGDEWAGDPARGRLPWRDTMVSVCGPAVPALDASFARMWGRSGGAVPDSEFEPAPEPCGPSTVRVVEGQPGLSRTYRAVQMLAAAVTERLWITDAYLVAPPPLYAALVDAARSGVDVRFLLPGTSDVPIVRTFSRIGYRELLHSGARIFEWHGPMLHAKTLVADREWARVGSSNLNVSSLLGNYELDVMVDGDAFSETLAAQFRHDVAQAREIVIQTRRGMLPLPARLVGAPAAIPAATPAHKRSRRELQAAAVVALAQVAGGARRMLAGAAAIVVALGGTLLILFPTVMSLALAVGAFATSIALAGYALARRRRRQQADAA